MEIIGPGLGNVIYDRASAPPILRTVNAGYHLHSLKRFTIVKEELRTCHRIVIIVLAVNFKIDGTTAFAIDGKSRVPKASIAVPKHFVMGTRHARLGREGQSVKPGIHRQCSNLLRSKFR